MVRGKRGKVGLEKAKGKNSSVRDEVDTHMKKVRLADLMFREREELLSHHEERVIKLKKEFEEKLKSVSSREQKVSAKEKNLREAKKAAGKLLAEKGLLEGKCRKLRQEEQLVRSYVAKGRKEAGRLHDQEARVRSEVFRLSRKAGEVRAGYEESYLAAGRITTFLRAREAELRAVKKSLEEVSSRHAELVSQITHHSVKEVNACMKRTREHIRRGLVSKALGEYEQIRKYYVHLPRSEKEKAYASLGKIRADLLKCVAGKS